MASIRYEQHEGRNGWRLRYYLDGSRKSIWLGETRAAETWQAHIEHLLENRKKGDPPSASTTRWLASLTDEQHAKLEPLVPKRRRITKTSLAAFVDSCLESQKSELKDSSWIVYQNVRRNLVDYFGESRDIATISGQDAREFRTWMEEKSNARDKKRKSLAVNTVRRRTGVCRHLFEFAVEEGLIERNPFKRLPVTVRSNKDRQEYVTLETFNRLLEKVSDSRWRALLMLARLEAFRIPSEAVGLEWKHIDFKSQRLVILSPKTEGKGKAERVAPLLPRVAEQLRSLPRTDTRVFPGLVGESNLRTQLLKFIARAGLEPWPKLWQNLRASAATDFARTMPMHVAASICGHTVQVAREFYWQVSDSDLDEAISKLGGPAGGPNRGDSVTTADDSKARQKALETLKKAMKTLGVTSLDDLGRLLQIRP